MILEERLLAAFPNRTVRSALWHVVWAYEEMEDLEHSLGPAFAKSLRERRIDPNLGELIGEALVKLKRATALLEDSRVGLSVAEMDAKAERQLGA